MPLTSVGTASDHVPSGGVVSLSPNWYIIVVDLIPKPSSGAGDQSVAIFPCSNLTCVMYASKVLPLLFLKRTFLVPLMLELVVKVKLYF